MNNNVNRNTKVIIWKIFDWMDNSVNHKFVDEFFCLEIFEKNPKVDNFMYEIWKNTSFKFCQWVNIKLVEMLDLEDYVYPKK